MSNENTTPIHILRDVHKTAKVQSALNGESLREYVERAIIRQAKQDGKKSARL